MPILCCPICKTFFAPKKCEDCGQFVKDSCLGCHNRNHRFNMKLKYLGKDGLRQHGR